jgi:hypothetical protein
VYVNVVGEVLTVSLGISAAELSTETEELQKLKNRINISFFISLFYLYTD